MESVQKFHSAPRAFRECWQVKAAAANRWRQRQVREWKQEEKLKVCKHFSDPKSFIGITKFKVLNETLERIDAVYFRARLDIDALQEPEKNQQTFEIIDAASKPISDLMISGMKKLADLVEEDYFDILPQVFGDEEAEKSEKGQEVFEEMKQIYEQGEKYFAIFQEISDDLSEK